MAKRVRTDLQGAIWIGGRAYFAGAELPTDAEAGDHVLQAEPASSPKPLRKQPARRPQKRQSDG